MSEQPWCNLRNASYCDRSVVCPSVCTSVTFVHPVKAVGRNEMLRGQLKDTRIASSYHSSRPTRTAKILAVEIQEKMHRKKRQ